MNYQFKKSQSLSYLKKKKKTAMIKSIFFCRVPTSLSQEKTDVFYSGLGNLDI